MTEFKETVFEQLFERAEIAKFSPEEAKEYEDSLKNYRDIKNSIDTAREEERIEIAKSLLKNNVPVQLINSNPCFRLVISKYFL